MDSDALHVVAQEGTVFGRKVVQHLLSVGTDEVGAVGLCAYPFAVGGIDGDAGDGDVVEQVVCQSAAVVAVDFDLGELHVRIEDLGYIFYHEESCRSTYPYNAVKVLAEAEELAGLVGCAVLVRNVLVHNGLVVGGAFRTLRVDAEDASLFDASAADELDAAAVVQDFVYQRDAVQPLVVRIVPCAVGSEDMQHAVPHRRGHPEVAICIVAQGRAGDIVVVSRQFRQDAV